MIDFKNWLSQILGYCALITNRPAMRRAWTESDYSATSVTDFDELYEQIFDDLDSANFESALPTFLPNDPAALDALQQFLLALQNADHMRSQHAELRRPVDLLSSDVWADVEVAAEQVQSLIGQALSASKPHDVNDQRD